LPSTVEQLHREFAPRGLSVVAVNIQENAVRVAAWVRKHGLTLPVLLDGTGAVTSAYGVVATPTVFLLDRDGRLRGRVIGPRDWGSPETKAALTGLLG
jgi:cytochrome c biogenesis protein CcmG/thiol:disulfide interchange protein DsbE